MRNDAQRQYEDMSKWGPSKEFEKFALHIALTELFGDLKPSKDGQSCQGSVNSLCLPYRYRKCWQSIVAGCTLMAARHDHVRTPKIVERY